MVICIISYQFVHLIIAERESDVERESACVFHLAGVGI